MKKLIFFMLVLLGLPIAAIAQIESSKIESIEIIHCWTFPLPDDCPDGNPEFTICEPMLKDEPSWQGLESSPVPLSTSEAITLARKEISLYRNPALDWKLEQITLRQIRLGWDKWIYLVKWQAFDAANNRQEKLVIPVLLSGKVPVAKIK